MSAKANSIVGASGANQPPDPNKFSQDLHILDYFRRGVDIQKCTNKTKSDEKKTSYYADECACEAIPAGPLRDICMQGYNESEKNIPQQYVTNLPNKAVQWCLDESHVPDKYRQDLYPKLSYQVGCLNSIHGPMSTRPKNE